MAMIRRYLFASVAILAWLIGGVALAQMGSPGFSRGGVTQNRDPVVWTGTHTNTAQPCFLAHNSSGDTNVTGAGTTVIVDFDTEIFDQGADFAADTFTAPVAGRYMLSASVRLSGIESTADEVRMSIRTSNRNYRVEVTDTDDIPSIMNLVLSVVADMDANDTVDVIMQVSGVATNTTDIDGSSTLDTSFSGCLLV